MEIGVFQKNYLHLKYGNYFTCSLAAILILVYLENADLGLNLRIVGK
jgi:hypothetical protein